MTQADQPAVDPIKDPERVEPKLLEDLGSLKGASVLEVGSGDGRLTWRYAATAQHVVAIDPEWERVASAAAARPGSLKPRVSMIQAVSEALPFARSSFDVVLLAWSL